MQDSYHLISTPENVDLRLELAGLGNRVLACFIDTLITYFLIALLWGILLLTVFGLIWAAQRYKLESLIDLSGVSMTLSAISLLASFIITFGYFIFFEGIWQGQTPGKKIAGIRVVRDNGEPVSWAAVLLRNVLRTFDEGALLIGLIFMVVEKSEKRMGDLAAGTIVIRERKTIQPQVAKRAGSADDNQNDFAGVLPVQELDQADYELLNDFLRRRQYMLKPQRAALAKKLADYLSVKLNIESQTNPPTNPEIYLEKINNTNIVM